MDELGAGMFASAPSRAMPRKDVRDIHAGSARR
jgi:hypothetical protein